jgi:hypothetical protein
MAVPGSYRTVCTQLELTGIAVAAVLLSHRVNELEGALGASALARPGTPSLTTADTGVIDAAAAAAAAAAAGGPTSLMGQALDGKAVAAPAAPVTADEGLSVVPAFKVLKALVTKWFVPPLLAVRR